VPTQPFDALIVPGTEDSSRSIELDGASENRTLYIIIGSSAVGGALIALVLALFVAGRRREREDSVEALPTVIREPEARLDPRSMSDIDLKSDSVLSKIRANNLMSFGESSTNLEEDNMQPPTPLGFLLRSTTPPPGVPILVDNEHNNDVESEMSPSSAMDEEERRCFCGSLGTKSDDAYMDGIEDPSFGKTEEALTDLMDAEKTIVSAESQSSSLKGIKLLETKESEDNVPEEKTQEPKGNFLGGMLGMVRSLTAPKPKPPLHDQAHYFDNDEPCRSGEVSLDFAENIQHGVLSDVGLANPSAMTPKRSNRSNEGKNSHRFFRGGESIISRNSRSSRR